MTKSNRKQLSNPFSTGGGGAHFEAHILASFVVLMLSGGYAPCLPCWPITKVKPQGKVDGYDTDDLIVFIDNKATKEQRKLLGQVKHTIAFTKGNKELPEVFQAAWTDFNNPRVFKQGEDIIALITEPLNKTDFNNVHWLLNQARHTANADEFYRHVERAKFSPSKAEEKLAVIRHHLQHANNNSPLSQDKLYSFLRHFHLRSGVITLGELASRDPGGIWSNRPGNSLSTILLPWNPHTIAPLEKRKAVINILCEELPKIGWQLVLDFLPNQHQMTWGSYKPLWRKTIPDDWKEGVTKQEYWEQVYFCGELAVSLAGHDIDRLSELANLLENLPGPSFDKFLEVLSSDAITGIPEEKLLSISNRLNKFITKNRLYPQAAWNNEQLEAIHIRTFAEKPHKPEFSDKPVPTSDNQKREQF